MNLFVERLPWRVAALAGLIVGVLRLRGGADVWNSLLWVGAAFFLFGLLGMGLRAIMLQGTAAPPEPRNRGQHFDQTTPETPEKPPPSSSDVK